MVGGLLDHCIVNIVRIDNKNILYQHKNFKQGNFTVKDTKVFLNGKDYVPQCRDNKQALRLANFMNGKTNSK